jgi:hypothetical protein
MLGYHTIPFGLFEKVGHTAFHAYPSKTDGTHVWQSMQPWSSRLDVDIMKFHESGLAALPLFPVHDHLSIS